MGRDYGKRNIKTCSTASDGGHTHTRLAAYFNKDRKKEVDAVLSGERCCTLMWLSFGLGYDPRAVHEQSGAPLTIRKQDDGYLERGAGDQRL